MFDRTSLGKKARRFLALGLVLFACAPLASQAADTGKSMHLKVSDLDLSTDDGVRKLYRRIEQASFVVCDSQRDDMDVIVRGPGPCVRETVARTVHDLGLSSLARLYIKENGAAAAQRFDISDEVRTARN
jgi:UrcA family protein